MNQNKEVNQERERCQLQEIDYNTVRSCEENCQNNGKRKPLANSCPASTEKENLIRAREQRAPERISLKNNEIDRILYVFKCTQEFSLF
jgi:hypothetical protein